MKKYKLIENGVRNIETGQNIPNNSNNRDWIKYLEWLNQGNIPDPEYSDAEIIKIEEEKNKNINNKVGIEAIMNKYKNKNKSDITDEDAIEFIKLKIAGDLKLEL